MSFAPEVIADDTGKWYGNSLRFATRDEAMANVKDLFTRWTLVTDYRVVESSLPVTHRWVPGVGLAERIEAEAMTLERWRIVVDQLVADELLAHEEDRQRKPAGKYLIAAPDEAAALEEFFRTIGIAGISDFSVRVEPFGRV